MTNDYNTQPVENENGGIGRLRVRVDLGSEGAPAQGATVRVTDPESGKRSPIWSRTERAARRRSSFPRRPPRIRRNTDSRVRSTSTI